jgi:hypothetical protein
VEGVTYDPQTGLRVRHLGGPYLYKSYVSCPCAYLQVPGLAIPTTTICPPVLPLVGCRSKTPIANVRGRMMVMIIRRIRRTWPEINLHRCETKYSAQTESTCPSKTRNHNMPAWQDFSEPTQNRFCAVESASREEISNSQPPHHGQDGVFKTKSTSVIRNRVRNRVT